MVLEPAVFENRSGVVNQPVCDEVVHDDEVQETCRARMAVNGECNRGTCVAWARLTSPLAPVRRATFMTWFPLFVCVANDTAPPLVSVLGVPTDELRLPSYVHCRTRAGAAGVTPRRARSGSSGAVRAGSRIARQPPPPSDGDDDERGDRDGVL